MADEHGVATIEGLAPGTYTIKATAPLHHAAEKEVSLTLADGEFKQISIYLDRHENYLGNKIQFINPNGIFIQYYEWPGDMEIWSDPEDVNSLAQAGKHIFTNTRALRIHWPEGARMPNLAADIQRNLLAFDIVNLVLLAPTEVWDIPMFIADLARFIYENADNTDTKNADGSSDYYVITAENVHLPERIYIPVFPYVIQDIHWWTFAGFITDEDEVVKDEERVNVIGEGIVPPRTGHFVSGLPCSRRETGNHFPNHYLTHVEKCDLEVAGVQIMDSEARVQSFPGYPQMAGRGTNAVAAGKPVVLQIPVVDNAALGYRPGILQAWYRKGETDSWHFIGSDLVYPLEPYGCYTTAFSFTPGWDLAGDPYTPQEDEIRVTLKLVDGNSFTNLAAIMGEWYGVTEGTTPDFNIGNEQATLKLLVYPPAAAAKSADLAVDSLEVTTEQPWPHVDEYMATYNVEVTNRGSEPMQSFSIVGYLDGEQVAAQTPDREGSPALLPGETRTFALWTAQYGADSYFPAGEHEAKVELIPYPIGFSNEL